ncbi:hypothetical protein [Streptomyces sp. NPDC020983]|uniref:hypothetical protein n=1 Tax=Streptomyces sp. NPDC020983 TaxID=3365106 RepID=UPI0037B92715
MTPRLPPLAARATMAAAIEDRLRDGVNDPTVLAQAAAKALADAGWTIAPTVGATGRQMPARDAARSSVERVA